MYPRPQLCLVEKSKEIFLRFVFKIFHAYLGDIVSIFLLTMTGILGSVKYLKTAEMHLIGIYVNSQDCLPSSPSVHNLKSPTKFCLDQETCLKLFSYQPVYNPPTTRLSSF